MDLNGPQFEDKDTGSVAKSGEFASALSEAKAECEAEFYKNANHGVLNNTIPAGSNKAKVKAGYGID